VKSVLKKRGRFLRYHGLTIDKKGKRRIQKEKRGEKQALKPGKTPKISEKPLLANSKRKSGKER